MSIGNTFQKKMMVGFRMDRGKWKSSHNSFSVGFSEADMKSEDIQKHIVNKKGTFYRTLKFPKADTPLQKELWYPEDQNLSDFYLSCMFGSGTHSRCAAVLSKTQRN